MVKVDFSYKVDALRIYYDIECLPSVFTCTLFDGNTATLWFYGDPAYDQISDNELIAAFAEYIAEQQDDPQLNLNANCAIELVRAHTDNHAEILRLRKCVEKLMYCQPQSNNSGTSFAEYIGWNSSAYDLPMLVAIHQALLKFATPQEIRAISNATIRYKGRPNKFGDYLAETFMGETLAVGGDTFRKNYNASIFFDGHIDVAKLLRAQDENGDQSFPPALKVQEARRGMDIIADDAVSNSDAHSILTKTQLLDFIKYNLHDVVATRLEGESDDVRTKVSTRDTIREMYPYTSARAKSAADVLKFAPPERDITEAQLSALSFIGEKKTRPTDYPYVKFEFPTPKQGVTDLLEYTKATERFMPEKLYQFFDFWRGQNTSDRHIFHRISREFNKVVGGKVTALNIPYYRFDAASNTYVPIDAFIRVSTGGAHGSVWTGLSDMNPETISAWTNADATPSKLEKRRHIPTVDETGVVHIDFTSYYPTLCIAMGVYQLEGGHDPMLEMKDKRVAIKAELSKYPDPSVWTKAQFDMESQQLALKMQLNAPTGASNMHSKYALLPLDNKILSMRLIGNLMIWCLGQRLVHAGAFILSTNTDGLYISGISVEQSQQVIDEFVADYNIPVDPEPVDRFINRDVSNRLELIDHGENGYFVKDCRGRLRSANKLVYNDMDHGHNVAYPLAVGNAVIRYMTEDPDWSHKPYDKKRLMSILQTIKQESDIMAWVHIYSGTSARHMLVNGEKQQKVVRVALCKRGLPLKQESLAKPTKDLLLTFEAALSNSKTTEEAISKVGAKFPLWVHDRPLEAFWFARKTVAKYRREADTYDRVESASAANCLMCELDGQSVEVKVWSESVLTGYPKNPLGVVLNGRSELLSFDLDNLDLKKYLEWAETMLEVWKIGAQIDYSKGKLIMDNVVDHMSCAPSRKTKKDVAQEQILELYRSAVC